MVYLFPNFDYSFAGMTQKFPVKYTRYSVNTLFFWIYPVLTISKSGSFNFVYPISTFGSSKLNKLKPCWRINKILFIRKVY